MSTDDPELCQPSARDRADLDDTPLGETFDAASEHDTYYDWPRVDSLDSWPNIFGGGL